MSTPRVVVVGGSLAGLAAALFCARRGHRVVVLEQDPAPTPPDIETAARWRRTPTPQAAHSHAFIGLCRDILVNEAPDVLADLINAGARQAILAEALPPTLDGYQPAPEDRELVTLNARRPVFEWVLRRAADRQPGVDMRCGVAVAGLESRANGLTRVTAALTPQGPVSADLVVDAGGKRSAVRRFARRSTGSAPEAPPLDVPCGIAYFTRFYRLRSGEPTALNRGYTHGASFDRYSCLVFPADNDSFSITFGTLPEDRDLAVLGGPAGFAAAAKSIPLIAPWVDPAASEPISAVARMASLHNVLGSGTTDLPRGLVAVGDACCVTNPAHTRGTALALLAAQRLAVAVTDHAGDPVAVSEATAAFIDNELAGWVDDSIAQDRARLARWRPHESPSDSRTPTTVSNGDAFLAAHRDPYAWRAFTRLQQGLSAPAQVLNDPAMVNSVQRIKSSGWQPPAPDAPSHDELVDIARTA